VAVGLKAKRIDCKLVMLKISSLMVGLIVLSQGVAAHAATVSIHPSLDNTIYSESSNSNGQGALFTGTTANLAWTRRALVAFDVLGNIPAGSVINSVSLTFVQVKIGPGGASDATFEVRPVSQAWGEGSSAGTGGGAAASVGDATWTSRFFTTSSWTTAGGDFGATSASTVFSSPLTSYTFASTPALVADVQGWLGNPSSNFGWLLKAAAENVTNARELGSGESPLNQQPTLVINYTAVPEPSLSGLLVLGLAGLTRRRRC
jgi:hypothetical protein